ncbi:glyoxalase/bleomycin resistance/extradiol dioxygenase family protein [Luteolibacter sp. GHJ8]|uniref:Glyoxalase/bleomycin resistance/extradiol dioxygenase family protein n=1 Tax=Luteolibacter rhizosphaerae TaxID=2989719 RepID=A0ABT3G3S4_9BACT|nr:VOC family protein [Luteolibacter rhizosphaerae]MCW1914496.1 glyoxalase/bleomycin resistance/extradiol dioxygenase family protein [Luteolibacter rhizosphaerae]
MSSSATDTAPATTVSQIFVNLPVKNLDASMAFFKALGFSFNPDFTDSNAACLILGPNLYSMLLTHPYFNGFAPRPAEESAKHCEVLVALSLESREKVDDVVSRAVAAGGATYSEPKDHGFMYQHGFTDLDGHVWEVFVMSGMPPKE